MTLPLTYSRRKRIRDSEGKTPELRTSPIGPALLQQLFNCFNYIDQQLSPFGEPLFNALVLHLRQDIPLGRLSQGKSTAEEFYWWWMGEGAFTDPYHDFRLDAIEIACSYPFTYIRELSATEPHMAYKPADEIRKLIAEINARMAESGFGYRFDRGQVVEVASEYLYDAAVLPVLGLTAQPAFAAVDQEFRDALAEFRAGNYDDCIADCGNAFESALKVIAALKRWETKPNDRAAALIGIAFDKGLLPQHLQSQFTGLRSVIQGIPTMRNNEGGHGSGVKPRVVERHFAEYQLHQTAAAILFLIKAAE